MKENVLYAKFRVGQKIYNCNNKCSGTITEIHVKRFDGTDMDEIAYTYFEVRYMVQDGTKISEWHERVMRAFPKEGAKICACCCNKGDDL